VQYNLHKSVVNSFTLAEHQGPQDHGGARPKTTQGTPPGSLGTTKPTAKEQTDEGNTS